MTAETGQQLDASRWARLKDHVADLNDLDPAERPAAMAALQLDATDQRWLEQLVPMLAADARLRAPHPSARTAADMDTLRCQIGDIVGRYRVDGLLGRGGMGEVYEASALEDGAVVALKVLRSGLAQSDYARFSENEQRALRRLDDPRIARFIEAFVAPDVGACLVLEWIDGEPLQTYCRGRRYDVQARLKLFIDVCQAVASAHQQLVVHRDLKPGNVLVTPDGQIKLLDFGVSKLLDDGTGHALTQTHGDLFTLEYAAPEQVLREPVSTVTDVYALGVLLYRLLTEASPYARSEGGSLAKAVLNEAPQRLAAGVERARSEDAATVSGTLDRDLDRVIAHAMEKEPRNRYRSALELAADVQAVLDGRAIQGGGGTLYRLRKFTARNRAAATAGAFALLALLAATGVSLYAAQHAAQQAHRAEVANRFLLTTLDLTDRFSGNNKGDLTLSDVLERAVANAHTELRDEPQVRADVLGQLSMALLHRGKLDAALTAAQEAHDIRSSSPDVDPAEFAASAQQLASIEIESGLLDAAGEHLDQALQKLALAGPQQRALIQTYTSLGKLASIRGDAAGSLRWYQKILPLRQSLPGDNALDLAMDYNNLGTGLHYLSRFTEAERTYAQSIDLLRERLGDNHPRIGFVQYSRLAPLIQLGRFDEAKSLLDTVQATLLDAGKPGVSAPGAVNIDRMRAILAYYASDYVDAHALLDSAVAKARSASPVNVAATLLWRGRIELASGDFSSASKSFAEADRLYLENGRTDHLSRWHERGLHGAAMVALGQSEAGERELDEALAKVIGDESRPSAEQIDLLLYSGAIDRRNGHLDGALAKHRKAQTMRDEIGWLGELGIARVDAELAQDVLVGEATPEARASALAGLNQAIKVIRQISPHDQDLPKLIALQASVAGSS